MSAVRTLSERMDFDHVIEVMPDGSVIDALGVYAPDLMDDDLGTDEWTLLDGFSGQQGYSGPLMHASEQIAGGMERRILSEPGLYVALVSTPSDDSEPTEWAVAFRPSLHDMTCGTCGRTWNSTTLPTPAARCPFEYDHTEETA